MPTRWHHFPKWFYGESRYESRQVKRFQRKVDNSLSLWSPFLFLNSEMMQAADTNVASVLERSLELMAPFPFWSVFSWSWVLLKRVSDHIQLSPQLFSLKLVSPPAAALLWSIRPIVLRGGGEIWTRIAWRQTMKEYHSKTSIDLPPSAPHLPVRCLAVKPWTAFTPLQVHFLLRSLHTDMNLNECGDSRAPDARRSLAPKQMTQIVSWLVDSNLATCSASSCVIFGFFFRFCWNRDMFIVAAHFRYNVADVGSNTAGTEPGRHAWVDAWVREWESLTWRERESSQTARSLCFHQPKHRFNALAAVRLSGMDKSKCLTWKKQHSFSVIVSLPVK